MNELELIDALIERLKAVNADFQYKKPNTKTDELVNFNYFDFDLPAKRSVAPNSDGFPYIITRMTDGKVQSRDDNIVNITMVIGIYDDDLEHQGYKDAVLAMMRIRRDLFANPILNNGAVFDSNFAWLVIDDQPYPYYKLAITTGWNIKSPQWSQHSELI
jgi:hypothetical protein